MDGNGRWARARGLARIEGHRAGAESVRRVVQACRQAGVKYLTLYAFSTENWRRPASEIAQLMRLLTAFLGEHLAELDEQRIRLNAIGELTRLPAPVRRALERVMRATARNDAGVLTLALSYGSRAEIVRAARQAAARVAAGTLRVEDITEESFAGLLQTAGMPDPDLIIRTANEMRLSNFLLWQASYAEIWVTPTLWPEFGAAEFGRALADYANRTRRFGAVV
jgi:undecaprenyl diphosphate synthase